MGYKCCVLGCRTGYSNYAKEPGVSLHRLPTDQATLELWLEKISRSGFTPTRNTRICSLHFVDTDFVTESCDTNRYRHPRALEKRRLRLEAVPLLYLSCSNPRRPQDRTESFSHLQREDPVPAMDTPEATPKQEDSYEEPTVHITVHTVHNNASPNQDDGYEEATVNNNAPTPDGPKPLHQVDVPTVVKDESFCPDIQFYDNHHVDEEEFDESRGQESDFTVKEEVSDLGEDHVIDQPAAVKEEAQGAAGDNDDLIRIKDEPDVSEEEEEDCKETLRKDLITGMDIEEEAGCSYDGVFLSNGSALSSDEGTSSFAGPDDISSLSGPAPAKRKRTELTVSAKLDLIDRYRQLNVKSRRQAANLLNVSHGFLNQVLKKEADLRGGVPTKIRNRCGKDKEIEEGLLRWLRETSAGGPAPLSGAMLCQKAEEIAARLGKAEFKATDGWLNRWKKRNSLLMPRKRKAEGEGEESLEELMTSYPPTAVFCAATAPLAFSLLPGDRPDAATAVLTVLLCCSLAGEREQLLVIGAEAAPKCFQHVRAFPTAFCAAPGASLSRELWDDWLQSWNCRLRAEMRRVLLIVPPGPQFHCPVRLSHIVLRAVQPHAATTTPVLLPIELGVAKALKGFYRRALYLRVCDMLEDCNAAVTPAAVLKKVTLMDALYLLTTAWRKVCPATIMQCWHDAGFHAASADPQGSNDPTPPPGLTAEDFDVWVAADDNLSPSGSQLAPQLGSIEQQQQEEEKEEEEEEEGQEAAIQTPSKSVMRVALQLLRIGLERRGFEGLETFSMMEEEVRECLRREPNA